ncbi:MAG: TonB-dependent receptor [Flavobacteriales bacterium]|nr:TonB-dependent receptor [Flavobacteriales bacterium]MBL6873300.1 TonB-dependent receptor [Flavobacteriales bacterium]
MKIFTLLIVCCCQLAVYSQNYTFSGIVKTTNNKVLPFASVSIKGTTDGTSADENGVFTLDVNNKKVDLQVSSVGYKTYRKTIDVSLINSEPLQIVLTSLAYDLDQVVVTGTMRETFLSASPVKVDVISHKFLKKIATANVMEVIENVNGVQKQINCGVCGTNDIHINGMEGPYTLVLIDGMPIMSSLSTVYGLNGISTSLIKQIEIIKGPSSTLYGTEAVAGVINIITKESKDISTIEIDLFGTSHFEKKLDFSIAPKFKKVDMLFSGNVFFMNHFLDDNEDNFSDVPFSNRISLFNKWSMKRKSNKKLSFSAKYYNEDRSGGVEEWNRDYRGSDSVYGESIFTDRFELVGSYQFPTKEDIRLDVSYNHHHQDAFYGDTKYEAWQQIYFSNLLWNKKIGYTHDVLVGTSQRYQMYKDSTLAMIDDKQYIPAIFLQDEITLNKKWSVLLGLRSDYHKEHRLVYSPRLNIKWNVGEQSTFRFNSGTGFRLVNLFTEDHAFLTGSRDVQIVEELEPEESYNVNLNFNHLLLLPRSTGAIDIDVFYTHFNNKIVPDYDIDPNLIVYANLDGFSVSRGFAFNIQQNFDFPLSLTLGGTFLDVYSESNGIKEKELFAPSFSGNTSLSYQFQHEFDLS